MGFDQRSEGEKDLTGCVKKKGPTIACGGRIPSVSPRRAAASKGEHYGREKEAVFLGKEKGVQKDLALRNVGNRKKEENRGEDIETHRRGKTSSLLAILLNQKPLPGDQNKLLTWAVVAHRKQSR